MGKINKEFGIDEEYLEYLRSIPVVYRICGLRL